MKVKEVRPTKSQKIFISFVEEYWPNQKKNTVLGRIEVTHPEDTLYSSEEIRIATFKENEYYKFREQWDFKYVSEKELNKIKNKVKELNQIKEDKSV